MKNITELSKLQSCFDACFCPFLKDCLFVIMCITYPTVLILNIGLFVFTRSQGFSHYGPVYILSAQGCVDSDLCSSHEMTSYRGVEYNVSHTCCCKDQCNTVLQGRWSLRKPQRPVCQGLHGEEGLRPGAQAAPQRNRLHHELQLL
uniref:UPAR/Ly6 domain-containing protein n=1 Tax=Labrus bergylta TaxID=56723 RepID=A0A3Q3FAA5_9LABR